MDQVFSALAQVGGWLAGRLGEIVGTNWFQTLVATLVGGAVAAWVGAAFAARFASRQVAESSRLASQQSEAMMRLESDGRARAAAKSLFSTLVRQYASLFGVQESLFGAIATAGPDSVRLQAIVRTFASVEFLAPPNELSDPFLNDHLNPDGAAAITRYAAGLEALRAYTELLTQILPPGGFPDEQTRQHVEKTRRLIADCLQKTRSIENLVFQLTAWSSNFFPPDERLRDQIVAGTQKPNAGKGQPQ